ncbi:1-3-beta-glucanosyltransferase [Fragilaria crotonensis]|nr:1-3-beta-glucanosyltransferase [Fragilaria crotonensis]
MGDGVLDRDAAAPSCYSPGLYQHGRRILDMTWSKYPNIIGAVLGNEVMDAPKTWAAAPCVLSYARDLKLHQPNVTLIYTMQHSGIGAALSAAEAVALTLEYMTVCGTIDVLGVNIESWCSSRQTYELNEDGSIGSYRDLYDHVVNISSVSAIPIIFSETGCAKDFFNRDNGLERYSRDWKQLPVVETEMSAVMSGFIAYAYDGPAINFKMTSGGPWDGLRPLPFAEDMDNFINQLDLLKDENETTTTTTTTTNTDYAGDNSSSLFDSPTCSSLIDHIAKLSGRPLIDIDEIPSYYLPKELPLNATVVEDIRNNDNNDNDDNDVAGSGGVTDLVTGIIHDNPLQTILILILVLIMFLIPFCRNKVMAWRRRVTTTNATATTEIPNGKPDAANVGRNYDTFA